MLPPLPQRSSRNLAVRVTKDALKHLRRGHPWVYDGSITSVSHGGAPGDLAVVFDDNRKFAAIGLWDPDSPIQIRVLTTSQATIDGAFWRARFAAADERRRRLLDDPGVTGLRLVHGENDDLPSLVIDRYGPVLVVKLYSAAWFAHLDEVLDAALDHWGADHVVLRLARNIAEAAPEGVIDGLLIASDPPPDPTPFLENGHAMTADPVAGQKTGYFLDQRANRALVGSHAADRDVLDVFSCHGGFSVHAATGGARTVHATDLSPFAVASAQRHVAQNAPGAQMRGTVGDAFQVMEQLASDGESYDLIVVDPPSFASRRNAIHGALRAYTRLTHLAVDLLRPGGLLLQASCSSRIDTDAFHDTVIGAVERTGRPFRLLEERAHDDDHPIGFAEGAYLKAILTEVG
ncbi:MAG: class I SAM-dependent methyltransferase [Actinomycetota bacterium]